MRVAALPLAPLMPRMIPFSFLSCHADRNAARSIERMRERMPTLWSWPRIASPIVKYGGNGVKSPASNPFG